MWHCMFIHSPYDDFVYSLLRPCPKLVIWKFYCSLQSGKSNIAPTDKARWLHIRRKKITPHVFEIALKAAHVYVCFATPESVLSALSKAIIVVIIRVIFVCAVSFISIELWAFRKWKVDKDFHFRFFSLIHL